MNSIELTQSQIKAYQNRATVFMFPLPKQHTPSKYNNKFSFSGFVGDYIEEEFIKLFAPIQKGDKDIFIKEEFQIVNNNNAYFILYKDGSSTQTFNRRNFRHDVCINDASTMEEYQSRYSFSKCIDVKCIRVQDFNINKLPTKEKKFYEQYTYHCTTEPISQKRTRAFRMFYNKQLKEHNINRTYDDNDYVFLVEFRR